MCGITGYLNFNGKPASSAIVRAMANMIAHRGPDDEGVYVDGALAFGHRRLSIIDLSSHAHQPMISSDGRYVLTYNGEIYNFHELRTELQAKGMKFTSHSDTEVLLQGYFHWGEEVLDRLNGMFAFAIWDRKEHSLFLARDRYGIKPLYVAHGPSFFAFGSEVKAMLPLPEFKSEINLEGLLEYMTFQNFITKDTLFQGVRLVPAGCWMRIEENGKISENRYWDYNFREPDHALSQKEYEEELVHLMEQAVNRQLIGDVPVNSYLSGGMDSGSISAIAARSVPDMRTFTIGFDMHSASGLEMGFDERNVAEFMSYKFGTEHYEMVLKAGDMERCMKKLVWHLEEPRVGQCYPNYYAAQLASKFGKVVLAGTGGDELFGGYPWRYYRAVANDNFDDYIDKYYKFWQRLIPNSIIKDIFSPIYGDVEHIWTRDIFKSVFSVHEDKLYTPEDYVNHSLYFEAKTFLQSLLVVEDKLAMAHGLECRVPFLDNDLVDFAMQVPVGMKLGNLSLVVNQDENEPGGKARKYFEKTNDGKLILRKAMQFFIPDEILQAQKQGFSAPDESWYRGESVEYVRETLLNSNAQIYNYMNFSVVKLLIEEHLSGKQNRRLLIWSLLYLEQWLNQFT